MADGHRLQTLHFLDLIQVEPSSGRIPTQGQELLLEQIVVDVALCDKFVVGALLCEHTLVQHHNAVCVAHGVQAMRHKE